nr:hypothetical protein [Petropleomorpha daqingensis]
MKGAHGGGQLREAERADIPAAALHDLFAKFEETTDREAAAALARNFLTHPEAHRIMRDEVMCSLVQGLAGKIGGKDAELKAALVMACTFGLGLARYLLQIPGLAQAQRADIERLLEPALRAVLDAGD